MKRFFGLTPGDILLLAVLLLSALFLFFLPLFSGDAGTAEILTADTQQAKTVSLDRDATYEITSRDIRLTVVVEEGQIFVSHSDCRDGICLKTPPISRAGQSIVCAPAGVVIRILGEEAVVDGVSG